ncbi:MAG TPA: T9SS type A sorting domain-containing protein, partial [Melioribacteraceae bacterium]|nr:T9SS type A sorting domain-containing protein [Melioribacteraceae bacterium]
IGINNLTFKFKRYDDYLMYQVMLYSLSTPIINNCKFDSSASCLGLLNGCIVNNTMFCNSEIAIQIMDSWDADYKINNSIFTFHDNQYILYGIYNDFGGGSFTIKDNLFIISPSKTFSSPLKIVTNLKVEINNNLFWGFKSGINLASFNTISTDTNYVINNIFSNFAGFSNIGGYCIIAGNQPKEYVIANNIFAKSKNGIYIDGYSSKSDYNLFYNIQEALYTNMQKGEHDFIADPMFVNDTAAVLGGTYNYKLQKYSPAIDTGDPSISDVDGTRSDIGMFGGPGGISYEYQDLAPKVVTGLQGEYEQSSNIVKLKWAKCTAADFKSYKIYKDINSNFTIDSTKLVAETNNNTFNDSLLKGTQKVYYKVTATDMAGNQSYPSAEVNVTITDVNDAEIKLNYNYELYQNYPNPFNPITTISYSLKEGGEVRIKLYDITGKLLQTIPEGEKDKGYNETQIDLSNYASGIYLYRMEVTGKGKIP